MNFQLNEMQQIAKQAFNQFVSINISPLADQFDASEKLPQEIIDKLAAKGYLGASIAKEFGGLAMDPITFGLLCAELGRGSMSILSLFTVHSMVSQVIERWGTNQQRQQWLSKLTRGQLIAAFALSEESAGSDLKSIKTCVSEDEKFFVLNGTKKWISGGQIADVFLVFARNHLGVVSAFLVPKESSGITIHPITGLYGFRSAMLARIDFKDCLIAKESLLGGLGSGLTHIASNTLDHGRYCIAWGCVGLAEACVEASLNYCNQRKQFNEFLSKFQLIQQMLADMVIHIKAANLLCLHAGYLKNNADPDSIIATTSAKYFAAKMVVQVANDALQIHGANGCSPEYPLQRYLRDAKITEIIEGSSQIQQILLAENALRESLVNKKNEVEVES